MNNEYKEMLERFDQICQNAKKELLCAKEENDIRHFILETKDYGNFDVVEYEKYKELQEENERLNNIIDGLIEEYINYMNKKDFAKKCNISRPYLDKLLKKMNRKEIYEFCKIRNKLKGDNK